MKESVLVVMKPDAMSKGLIGPILTKFLETNLTLVAVRLLQVTPGLAKAHYKHIYGQPFYQGTIDHILGKGYKDSRVLALVSYGDGAIKKCREITGATNPKEAAPGTVRGMFGCVTPKGVFENVLHVSSDQKEAEREIKLWFTPDEILMNLYPTERKTIQSSQQRVWV